MLHRVKDMSAEQRVALEALVGRALNQDESFVVRPAHIIKPAAQGKEREEAAQKLFAHMGKMAERASHVPEDELDVLIDEACHHARHGE